MVRGAVRPLSRATRGDLPRSGAASSERRRGARGAQIADFIAGMTDRYALAEHARLFDSTPELR